MCTVQTGSAKLPEKKKELSTGGDREGLGGRAQSPASNAEVVSETSTAFLSLRGLFRLQRNS